MVHGCEYIYMYTIYFTRYTYYRVRFNQCRLYTLCTQKSINERICFTFYLLTWTTVLLLTHTTKYARVGLLRLRRRLEVEALRLWFLFPAGTRYIRSVFLSTYFKIVWSLQFAYAKQLLFSIFISNLSSLPSFDRIFLLYSDARCFVFVLF